MRIGGTKYPTTRPTTCSLEPNPNAIIRLQRIRDIPINNGACGVTVAGGVVTAVSQNEHDYWPNTLYDAREAQTRDATAAASTDLALAGVMHYVELDVNNLRRWLAGQLAGIGAPNGANAKNDNGYIVYFSDRRGNKNQAGVPVETGEFGYEDTVNPGTAAGLPNGGLPETGEDANGNAALDLYGRIARNVPAFPLLTPTGSPCVAGYPNPLHAATLVTQVLTNASLGVLATVGANCAGAGQVALATPAVVKPLVARANRPLFFRRALKIVNGGLGNLPNGLTIASENPIYVQGDYNAQATNTLADPHVPAAIIADAVTLLSNNWNDLRSFSNPANPANRPATTLVIAWRSSAARVCSSHDPPLGRRRRTLAPTAARTTSFVSSRVGTTARRSTTGARSSASSPAGRRSEAISAAPTCMPRRTVDSTSTAIS